jgi:hypothetical protein
LKAYWLARPEEALASLREGGIVYLHFYAIGLPSIQREVASVGNAIPVLLLACNRMVSAPEGLIPSVVRPFALSLTIKNQPQEYIDTTRNTVAQHL